MLSHLSPQRLPAQSVHPLPPPIPHIPTVSPYHVMLGPEPEVGLRHVLQRGHHLRQQVLSAERHRTTAGLPGRQPSPAHRPRLDLWYGWRGGGGVVTGRVWICGTGGEGGVITGRVWIFGTGGGGQSKWETEGWTKVSVCVGVGRLVCNDTWELVQWM